MSETHLSSASATVKLLNDSKAGVVKNLILEFESLRADQQTENNEAGMIRMGAEQSSSSKPTSTFRSSTINSKNFVKQRVGQFDCKLDNENQSDKRKRHKSVAENNKSSSNKDFQRSKSVDLIRINKDQYLRCRQIGPKINGDTLKHEHLKQNEPATPKMENLAGIKTKKKLAERFKLPESAPATLDRKREGAKISAKDYNRRSIRSVKSMKKVFEGTDNLTTKKETINCDNISEKMLKASISQHATPDISKLDHTNHEVNSDHNGKELNESLENFTKMIISDETFSADIDLDNSELENSLQEVERTMNEIKERHNQSKLFVSEEKHEDIENLQIYVQQQDFPVDLEDEFGQRSFASLEDLNYTEAYNRQDDVLIVTTVASVERKTISDDTLPNNANKLIENAQKEEPELGCIDNKIYYSMGEIPILADPETKSEPTSNRSTLYSATNTNSTDSIEIYNKTESDEDIEKSNEHLYEEIRILENNVEIRNDSSNGYDRTIKTETIYDSFQNPRIAKVSNVNSVEHVANAETPIVVEEVEAAEVPRNPNLKPKLDYLIEELIDTERKYIKHLEKVVWDYMPVLTNEKLPPSLIGKSRFIFGNIKKIYSTTQRFYKALRICGNDHEEIAKTFLAFRHLFELYPLYSKNKPVADKYLLGDFKDVVTAREKQLNDRLGLASNLLTPIQRLGKYILFLQQIQKELQKSGLPSDNIYKAIETVRKQMSRGNDFIAIDSVKDCPVSLLEQGSFLMREKFNVIKPRKHEAMLFLFEEMLVITTVDPRNPEMFIYRDSIKLNEMGIITFDDQPLVFHLKRFASYKKGPKEHHEFVIEAKKNKDKKTWTEQIEKRLWDQLVKCKEEQRELHSNQGKRNSVVELPDRVRKKKAGYSSMPSEIRKDSPKSIFYFKVARDA